MSKLESTLPAISRYQAVKWFAMLLVLLSLLPTSGCRICADCEDLAYPAYGGAWQRTLREQGRVGSLLDPGGARASELVSRDEPSDPDEIERERQQDRRQGPSDLEREKEFESPDEDDLKSREQELRDRKLEDIESDRENELRDKRLDDIEVRIIQGRPPVMVKTE